MAFDFFALCNSYQTASRVTAEVRHRRSVIISALPEDYSARTKKTQNKIKYALEEAGIKITVSTLRADLSLIQSTVQFLQGGEHRRATLLDQATKAFPNAAAIRFFQKCGLDTWDKVMAAKAQAEQPPAPAVPEPVDAIQQFLLASHAVAEEFRQLRGENQRLTAENISTQNRLSILEGRIGALDLGQVEAFLSLARDLQGGKPEDKPKTPEPPASNYPEGPQSSDGFGKPVVYTEQFARNAKQLDRNRKEELDRVLSFLVDQGVRDPRIKVATWGGGKKGWMNLKLYKMFVIWEDTPTALVFHWIESSGKPICK